MSFSSLIASLGHLSPNFTPLGKNCWGPTQHVFPNRTQNQRPPRNKQRFKCLHQQPRCNWPPCLLQAPCGTRTPNQPVPLVHHTLVEFTPRHDPSQAVPGVHKVGPCDGIVPVLQHLDHIKGKIPLTPWILRRQSFPSEFQVGSATRLPEYLEITIIFIQCLQDTPPIAVVLSHSPSLMLKPRIREM